MHVGAKTVDASEGVRTTAGSFVRVSSTTASQARVGAISCTASNRAYVKDTASFRLGIGLNEGIVLRNGVIRKETGARQEWMETH